MQFQLKDLSIFVNVVENGSFTKAAEILYIAQPSISKSIQKLERELDVLLIDRSSRALRLTDAGEILYAKSKEIISTLDTISTSIADLSDLVTGHIRIGLPQIIGTVFFPKIAQIFSKRFPGVTMEIKEEGGLITERLVEKGELDIGFVVLPVQNDNLKSVSIYKDHFVLCVSSNHPLSKLKEVSLGELQNESFILFAKTFALHGLIVNACKQAEFQPNIGFESTQWDLVLELVSAELGITIIPRRLANKLNNVDIVSIPIINPMIEWNIGIITNKHAYQSFALKEFINVVMEVYRGIQEE